MGSVSKPETTEGPAGKLIELAETVPESLAGYRVLRRLGGGDVSAVYRAQQIDPERPVALKIVSPQITHKTDVGGVKLNLNSPEEVAAAFDEIVAAARKAAPDATIEGVSVQQMARPGTEIIVGVSTDPQFGPVLMFGLGGVLVEVLKDVSFRIIPIVARDARQMIHEIKGFPLLEGYRGQDPADLAALESLLLRVSDFVEQHPEVSELDLNPVFAYKDGALAVDARIVLS